MSEATTTAPSAAEPSTDAPTARLTSSEAIPLAYALTARMAQDAGVRLLAIKGVVLSHHELRDPRVSADIDVLVHPDERQRFVAAMKDAGWREAPASSSPQLMAPHAVNLLNDHWPFGVDTHDRFPGFLADAGEVFEELWRRRVVLTQAAQPVPATDLASSAAIHALHHLRERNNQSNVEAMDLLVAKAQSRLDDEDRADLARLATATGSSHSLTPFFTALSVALPEQHPAEASAAADWDRATGATQIDVWLHGWRSARLQDRPAFLWHSFQPDEERLRHLYFHDVETPLWKLRLRRTRYVLSAAFAMLRSRRQG